MNESLLLVDYENVGRVELATIPKGVRVLLFFGTSQKSVPTTFLKSALKLGERFVPIDVEGRGKNALDFHIAVYLGEYLAKAPTTGCMILSKDKGFDPLVKHLAGRHLAVRRVESVKDAFSVSRQTAGRDEAPNLGAAQKAAVNWLYGMQKNRRPRKRKGLVAHLNSHFAKKMSESQIQALIDQMIADKQLADLNGTLTYHF
jgi:hypothetical protein